MDEGSGTTVYDESFNNNNGTLNNNVIKAVYSMTSSANSYQYEDLSSVTDYIIQSGDYLEYDVYWTSSTDFIAVDYTTTDSSALRDAGAVDQNGANAHPYADISAYALKKWYHRKIALPSGHVGKTIQYYDIACENNDTATKTGYINNIVITNGAGIIRKVIYQGGSFTHAVHLSSNGAISSFANDNDPKSWVSGKYGSAIDFRGDDYIDTVLNIDTYSVLTVEAWVYPTLAEDNVYKLIWGNDNGGFDRALSIGSALSGTSNWTVFVGDTAVDTGVSVDVNKWVHTTVVYSSTDTELYLNGVKVWSRGSASTGYSGSSNFKIGRSDYSGGTSYFKGTIDDVRIYNYARTADEILADYNTGKAAHLGEDNQQEDEGLVGYWNFEEGSGQTVYDRSGNGNNGTLGASTAIGKDDPVFTPGRDSNGPGGTGLQFDGVDDYVDAGTPTNLWLLGDQSFSLSAWIYPIATRLDGTFVSYGNAGANQVISISADSSGKIYSVHYGNDHSFNSSWQLNKWQNVVITYDSTTSTEKLYVDGVYKEQWAPGDLNLQSGNKLYFGRSSWNNVFANLARIDEIRIYNRALSADEIRMHYNQKKPVLHLKMDEGSGTTVHDESFNNNDGTVYGANGTAESGTSSTLTDTDKSWTTDEWKDETIEITSGQTRTVSSNTADTITVTSNWATTPDSTSVYRITSKDEWTTGKYGSAIDFDYLDDYVEVTNFPFIPPPFTLSAWVKNDSIANAYYSIISKGGVFANDTNFAFGYRRSSTSANLYLYWRNGSTLYGKEKPMGISPETGEWHFVTGVVDSNYDLELFVDGVSIGADSGNSIPTDGSQPLRIGGHNGSGNDRNWDGLIDDVRVYNYARTQDEILADYNAGKAARLGKNNQRDDGLVGYWNMEEGSGQTVYDRSGNGNDGTLGANSSVGKDDPVFASGHTSSGPGGTGLQFDGVDDYVNAGTDSSLDLGAGAFSIQMWIKPSTISVTQGFLEKAAANVNPGFALQQVSADLYFYVNGNTADVTITNFFDTADVWYYITITRNSSGSLTIYKNAVSAGTGSDSGNVDTSDNLLIGALDGSYASNFNGAIDEVRIYNRALSADEIRMHYNQKKPVAHFKFDEGSGTIVYDEGFNNNDGTLYLGSSGNTTVANAWVDGKHGSAIDFDGSDDYVGTIDALSTSAYTVSAWVWVANGGGQPDGVLGSIVTALETGWSTGDFSLGVDNDGNAVWYVIGSPGLILESNTLVNDGAWHHITGVNNGSLSFLYVDGNEEGTGASSISSASPAHIQIGARDSTARRFFDGLIDDVRIYNYARTADEILTDYNAGLAAHLR
jgi:hypothetical protein